MAIVARARCPLLSNLAPSVALLVALSLAAVSVGTVHAAHGMALTGEVKYPVDFVSFDYVNPGAPKGGHIYLAAIGNYDKLNPFTLKGIPATGVNALVFDTLTWGSLDEPFSMYGLLAQDIELAADRLSVTFKLNPKARFVNGDPVLADDVKFSFDTLRSKDAGPLWRQYWQDVKQAVVVDTLTIRFEFAQRNRELHMIVGSVPVFSRKWLAGKRIDEIIAEPPIASGPYQVDQFSLGKSITFKRNPNYWAADLPSRRGQYNFDQVTYTYFQDEFARIEAYKAGAFDFVHENAAKNWARGYFGRKFNDGTLIKTELANSNSQGLQAFVMNSRRPVFSDPRVRKAIGLAMDFEWMNRQLFFNQYKRSPSYFTNTELAARGAPSAAELALLEPFRSQLPAEVFGEVIAPPSTALPRSLRANLLEARELLTQAGWSYRDGALRNTKGEPFEFEIINNIRPWERLIAPFARNLDKLGIKLKLRNMDTSLLKKREDEFDYDMTVHWWLAGQIPGNELRGNFASAAASEKGSDNFAGVKSPVVDAMIEKIMQVASHEELISAARALDRVLLSGYYVVPHFHNNVHRVSYKSTLARPVKLPLYYQSEAWLLQSWWFKPEALAK